jgi:hypothetical protein
VAEVNTDPRVNPISLLQRLFISRWAWRCLAFGEFDPGQPVPENFRARTALA